MEVATGYWRRESKLLQGYSRLVFVVHNGLKPVGVPNARVL
jgi:hypothetical protein